MNNSSLLIPEEINEVEGERMSSIVIDLETHGSSQSIISDTSIETPLKSILKKSSDYSEEDRLLQLRAAKVCTSIIILIICIPIIFCDIYYSLTDVSCVNERPSYLDISLKLYLLLSGIINLILIIIAITIIIFIKDFSDKNDISYLFAKYTLYIQTIFNLAWNLIGSIVFWGYIYENGSCKIGVSTYVFISLIIKLLGSFLSFCHNKK